MNMTKTTIFAKAACVLMAAALAVCLVGMCGCTSDKPATDEGSDAQRSETYQVAAMKGPTSIGLAWAMQEQGQLDAGADAGQAPAQAAQGAQSSQAAQGTQAAQAAQTESEQQHGAYKFTVAASADELVPQISQGQFDFALVPANVAANIYNKTEGSMRAIAVNTLGVLYGLAYGDDIRNIGDLTGRTIYMSGKGTIPEYTVTYLLQSAGIADQVNVVFASEPSEALARLANDHAGVAIVPEPFATSALAKDNELSRVLDLTQLWDESAAGANAGGRLVTGVTIARASLIESDPAAIENFLAMSAESVAAANSDPSSIAATLVDLGILGNEAIAPAAVPRCNVVCITGAQMQSDLSGYLAALYNVEPASVGGQLPDDSFYYIG